jgi:hypothetical protein
MHAEESGERTQDMMGPRVMLPLQHKKSDSYFYAWAHSSVFWHHHAVEGLRSMQLLRKVN